jgi:DNA invertase Pin-like site-specific DNA recombinase
MVHADLVVIAEDLKGRSVGLKVLTGEGAAVDTTQPQGRMVFGILAVFGRVRPRDAGFSVVILSD